MNYVPAEKETQINFIMIFSSFRITREPFGSDVNGKEENPS